MVTARSKVMAGVKARTRARVMPASVLELSFTISHNTM